MHPQVYRYTQPETPDPMAYTIRSDGISHSLTIPPKAQKDQMYPNCIRTDLSIAIHIPKLPDTLYFLGRVAN